MITKKAKFNHDHHDHEAQCCLVVQPEWRYCHGCVHLPAEVVGAGRCAPTFCTGLLTFLLLHLFMLLLY